MTETHQYAAIQLLQTDAQAPHLTVNEKLPFPKLLKPEQVVIKIIYAAINPSDFMVLRGMYVVEKTLPAVPGTVGVGVVVAAGRAFRSRWLLGKRVACAGNYTGDGTWGQYLLTTNAAVMPLKKAVSDEIGANLLSNPNTALALMADLKQLRVKAFIQSAAASDIGQLLQFAAQENGIQVINIVRRPEHVALLQSKFGFPTLNSTDPNFDQDLAAAARQFKPTVFLDAVSGELTSRIARVLAYQGRIILYGKLSGQAPVIDQGLLGQQGLTLKAFSIMNWLKSQSLPRLLQYTLQLQDFGRKHTGAEIRGVIGLNQLMNGWPEYEKQSGQGKYLLDPFKSAAR